MTHRLSTNQQWLWLWRPAPFPKIARASMRQLCVAAFAQEIAPFLTTEELHDLQRTSWLLRTTYGRHACRPDRVRRAQQVVSLVHALEPLARDLRAALQTTSTNSTHSKRKRSKAGGVRLRDDQLLPLVRDLVLVGLGVRASCLVDTCQLDEESAHAMTTAFSANKRWGDYGLDRLLVVQLSGNVFFVNTAEFVRLKCLDVVTRLRNVALINASGELHAPQQITHASADGEMIQSGLVDAVKRLVDRLLDQTKTNSIVRRPIAFAPEAICSTAMAGLILCYPVVYHTGAAISAKDIWSTSDNCLGHCPLHLFQTSVMLEGNPDELHVSSIRLVLQEFSLPQQLHSDRDDARVTPQIIVAQCKRALESAVGGTGQLSIGVDVRARTLPHVAL